jgi:hypothetical protein
MIKPLPTGVSDYKLLIEGGYYYVDKTRLIKELLQVGGAVALICRPRRFGKTLNLSMLRYFFEQSNTDTSNLFINSAIWADERFRALQGQYHVISLTFKDAKEATWEKNREKLVFVIAKEYLRHKATIEIHSTVIHADELAMFHRLGSKKGSDTEISESIKFLSELLYKVTKKQAILLLDEYDAPIHASFLHGYYNDMINFMSGLLTAALKDNENIERGALTGILRSAKEGIFSGLNNLNVFTILNDSFADKFGFMTPEVETFFAHQDIPFNEQSIKEWYDG